jgi:hypothetical protein
VGGHDDAPEAARGLQHPVGEPGKRCRAQDRPSDTTGHDHLLGIVLEPV